MNALPPSSLRLVRSRFLLVAVWIPLALVVAAIAVQLVMMPQLPAMIAVHWNAGGQADGFAPVWTQPLMTAVLGLIIPALLAGMALAGLRRGDSGPMYRLLGALALGLSTMLTVMFTATFVIQAGLQDAADAPTIWPSLVAGLAAGILLGVLGWFLQPHQDAVRAPARPAAPLALADRERVLWIRTATMTTAAALGIVGVSLSVCVAAAISWVLGVDVAVAAILTGIAVVLLVAVATTVAFRVRVDTTGLHVDSVVGLPRLRVPLGDITSAARVEVQPMGEFGGWGLRVGMGRRFGVVLRAGEALEVTRRGGRRLVVTVDDAQTAASLLEALIARDSGTIAV